MFGKFDVNNKTYCMPFFSLMTAKSDIKIYICIDDIYILTVLQKESQLLCFLISLNINLHEAFSEKNYFIKIVFRRTEKMINNVFNIIALLLLISAI